MSINVDSHFAMNPTSVGMNRSKFNMDHDVKVSFNVGDIIPFECFEVLPGDTLQFRTNKVMRLQTLITPVMDNVYLDTYYFFVPNRIVWEHWKQLQGENTDSAWIPTTTYEVPQITSPASTGWNVGTIADYFGIPTGVPNLSVNALPFRAYALICNEFFRDENLSDPLLIPTNDSTVAGVNTGTFVNDVAKGGLPYTASKYHDYFTSCLPYPQKGQDVPIPIASGSGSSLAPVFGNGKGLALTEGTHIGAPGLNTSISFWPDESNFGKSVGSSAGQVDGFTPSQVIGVPTKTQLGTDLSNSGLVADVTGSFFVNAGTINELRLAFQMQKALERDALGGSRYIEILKSHFSVTSPDYRLQRPEYLGGNRLPLNINQVVQNSQTATTPQGTTTAYSLTTDSHGDFIKSFTEHGFVIGVCVARYTHSYQQGLHKMWTRKGRFDYYLPVFANIGEQSVFNREIYAQGSTVKDVDGNIIDDKTFGYQEAWAEYRYCPNRISGEMRSTYSAPLDSWHLADKYTSLPALSDSWIREDKTNVDRALAIKSSTHHQIFGDIYLQVQATRVMPVYSIPGLIDHN